MSTPVTFTTTRNGFLACLILFEIKLKQRFWNKSLSVSLHTNFSLVLRRVSELAYTENDLKTSISSGWRGTACHVKQTRDLDRTFLVSVITCRWFFLPFTMIAILETCSPLSYAVGESALRNLSYGLRPLETTHLILLQIYAHKFVNHCTRSCCTYK